MKLWTFYSYCLLIDKKEGTIIQNFLKINYNLHKKIKYLTNIQRSLLELVRILFYWINSLIVKEIFSLSEFKMFNFISIQFQMFLKNLLKKIIKYFIIIEKTNNLYNKIM